MLFYRMVAFFKKPFFSNYRIIFSIYALLTLFVSLRIILVDGSNNYQIFYYSLEHLIRGKSLYALYPTEYGDHYHYAPTFAALFSPVFALPYSVGLFLWHFLFAGVWVLAIYRMPFTQQQKVFTYWFGLQELFTSLVNSQTNPFIAAIPLFAFISFEKKQPFWAAFFIVLGFNIKIYSLVAGALFLLYPQKGRFLVSASLWAVLLGLLPIFFTSFDKLIWQYDLWISELFVKSDHDKWANTSIHRLTHVFISPDVATSVIVGLGIVLFCTVYIQVRKFTQTDFRMLMVASILIFQVIFNPVSESPTYITAVTGVLVWWFYCPKLWLDWVLLISCLIFTVFSPSDIFPVFLREQFVKPYVLKALPCVLIWFRVIYLMHISALIKHRQIDLSAHS